MTNCCEFDQSSVTILLFINKLLDFTITTLVATNQRRHQTLKFSLFTIFPLVILGMANFGVGSGSGSRFEFSLPGSGPGHHFLLPGLGLKLDFFSSGSGTGSTQKNPGFRILGFEPGSMNQFLKF